MNEPSDELTGPSEVTGRPTPTPPVPAGGSRSPSPSTHTADPSANPQDQPRPVDVVAAVSEYESALLRYVSRLLGGNADQAQDIVQEVFLRLHRQVDAHGPMSIQNLSSWLFRVAHNQVMDLARRHEREGRARQHAVEQTLAGQTPATRLDDQNVVGDLERREACAKAVAELQLLPEEHRSILLLRIVQGMSLREIAEVTGLTVGNAGYRLNQGLQELARKLKDSGVI